MLIPNPLQVKVGKLEHHALDVAEISDLWWNDVNQSNAVIPGHTIYRKMQVSLMIVSVNISKTALSANN